MQLLLTKIVFHDVLFTIFSQFCVLSGISIIVNANFTIKHGHLLIYIEINAGEISASYLHWTRLLIGIIYYLSDIKFALSQS